MTVRGDKEFSQATIGLSKLERQDYMALKLSLDDQIKIGQLLQERYALNQFVILHLKEKILSDKTMFNRAIKSFFSINHNIPYSLQKVNVIENEINEILEELHLKPLFKEETTKKYRLMLLLDSAKEYKETLYSDPLKSNYLTRLIEEMEKLESQEFKLRDKDLLNIEDIDIKSFMRKLKDIGITWDLSADDELDTGMGLLHLNNIMTILEKIFPKPNDHDDENKPKPGR